MEAESTTATAIAHFLPNQIVDDLYLPQRTYFRITGVDELHPEPTCRIISALFHSREVGNNDEHGNKSNLDSCSAWALTEWTQKQYQSQSQTHDYGCLFAPQSAPFAILLSFSF